MTLKETAEQIVSRFNIDSCDWTDYPDTELEKAIETALLAERERCAKIIETADLADWVKKGGALRDVLAAAIRTETDK